MRLPAPGINTNKPAALGLLGFLGLTNGISRLLSGACEGDGVGELLPVLGEGTTGTIGLIEGLGTGPGFTNGMSRTAFGSLGEIGLTITGESIGASIMGAGIITGSTLSGADPPWEVDLFTG